jgi:hypothetical protein
MFDSCHASKASDYHTFLFEMKCYFQVKLKQSDKLLSMFNMQIRFMVIWSTLWECSTGWWLVLICYEKKYCWLIGAKWLVLMGCRGKVPLTDGWYAQFKWEWVKKKAAQVSDALPNARSLKLLLPMQLTRWEWKKCMSGRLKDIERVIRLCNRSIKVILFY